MTAFRSLNPRLISSLALGFAVFAATLWGAGFWDKKDYHQWSQREIVKLFQDSPWAKTVTISGGPPAGGFAGGGGAGARRGGGGGGPRGGGGGAPGGGGGAGGAGGGRGAGGFGGGGGGMPQMSATHSVVIRFSEALPLKEANVKSRLGESTVLSPEMVGYLEQQPDYYVVSVVNLPGMLARFANNTEPLLGTARLRRKKKDDLHPAKVDIQTLADGSVALNYSFAKADPISLDDREVEFHMKLERPGGQGRGGQGAGRGAGAQRGQGGPGGQRQGGAGGQRPGAGGQGQRGGGRTAMLVLGKDIRKKFRLKDMVYKGSLAL